MSVTLKNCQIHSIIKTIKSKDKKKENAVNFILSKCDVANDQLKNVVSSYVEKKFYPQYSKKIQQCRHNLRFFESKYKTWLEEDVCIEFQVPPEIGDNYHDDSGLCPKRGRPVKDFYACSIPVKRARTAELRKKYSVSELVFATQMALRLNGNKTAANIVKDVENNPEEHLLAALKVLQNGPVTIKNYTPQEAAILVAAYGLTKHQYIFLRQGARIRNANLYPSYYAVQQAKNLSYPKNIDYSDTYCRVPLKDLVSHTVERIFESTEFSFSDERVVRQKIFKLEWKYGFDSSSGHSNYKQKSPEGFSDDSLLCTCLVPLIMIDVETNDVLWVNERPGSTRLCRPVEIRWAKETNQVIIELEENIKAEIDSLSPYKKGNIEVQSSFNMTMVDGKVCNALMDASGQRCYICGATSKETVDTDKLSKKIPKENSFQFGLSILHAYIRFFECIIHIGYKLSVKQWRIPAKDKIKTEIVDNEKKRIQEEFKTKLCLVVDKPKPGFGSSNDGNTARRFFDNVDTAAEITGVEKNLIYRFSIILKTLSCGYVINIEAFEAFCSETTKLYISLYGKWYYMPITVHKILSHGPLIITKFVLPIGHYTEECLESQHKKTKESRRFYARKMSRKANNEDVFNRLMITSDPYLFKIAPPLKNRKHDLPEDVFNLLDLKDEIDHDSDDNILNIEREIFVELQEIEEELEEEYEEEDPKEDNEN